MQVIPVAVLLALSVFSPSARAQRARPSCDRTTSRIAFGTDGGNMRPLRTTIAPDGSVTRTRDTLSTPESLARVDTAVVRALTHLAWSGAVQAHRLTAARPLVNRDMAYEYIEIATPCERRRAEYQAGAPQRFRDLYTLLTAVVK